MTPQSWFDPDRFYKHFEEYAPLASMDYDAMCAELASRWAAERDEPARVAERAALRESLTGHFQSIEAFRGDPAGRAAAASERFFEMFYLEHLALVLAMGRPDFFSEIVTVEGVEVLESAIAQAGSCVFALPHFGPHFAAHLMMIKLGYGAFASGSQTADFTRGHVKIAEHHGIDLGGIDGVDFDGDFKTNLMKLMFAGQSVTLYPEYSRSSRRGSFTASLFGQTVHAPTGVARLAAGFGKPVVGVSLQRRGTFRYSLVFDRAWTVEPGEEGIQAVVTDIFAWIEAMVLASPGDWEGWRYYHIMKANGLNVIMRSFAQARAATQARP